MSLEIPQNALYFSIEIGLGRSGYSIAPRDMKPVWTEVGGYHSTSYYDIHAKTNEVIQFEVDLEDALRDGEESYPDDTWLCLYFYDQSFKEVNKYESTVEQDYYNCDIEDDMRRVVRKFVKSLSKKE